MKVNEYELTFTVKIKIQNSFQFIKLVKTEVVPLNTWVTAKAPGKNILAGETPIACLFFSQI